MSRTSPRSQNRVAQHKTIGCRGQQALADNSRRFWQSAGSMSYKGSIVLICRANVSPICLALLPEDDVNALFTDPVLPGE